MAGSQVETQRHQIPGKPLRLAVIGLTHAHVGWALDAARNRTDVQIVGVWEPNRALFDRYAGDFAVDGELWSENLEAMLDRTRPEAASVMTSIQEHVMAVGALAPRKIATLIEKPLATSAAAAEKIQELSLAHGCPVLTNYETSWYSSIRHADSMRRAGELGPLRRMVFRTGHRGPVEIGCRKEFLAWLCDPVGNGGGALMDFGCYGVAQSLWMMGGREPETVRATCAHTKPNIYPKVEDDSTIVLEWKGGPTAVIQASWCWTHDYKETDLFGGLASAHCGKWDALHVRQADRLAEVVKPTPLAGPGADMWGYLAGVARGTIGVDSVSSLDLNVSVMRVLDRARESAGLPVPRL